jgi:hypothetical protein
MVNKLDPVIEKIKSRFQSNMSKIVATLEQDLATLAQLAPEPSPIPSGFASFAEACRPISRAQSQVELLNALVESAAKFAPRVALFILKEDTLHGWAAAGFSQGFCDGRIKRIHLRIAQYPELGRAMVENQSFTSNFSDLSHLADIVKDFDGFVPFLSAFFPLEVRAKNAALLYADSGSESTLQETQALALLAYIAGLELTQITAKIKKVRDHSTRSGERPKPTPPPDPTFDTGDYPESSGPKISAPPSPAPAPPASADGAEVQKAKRVARVLVSDLKLYHEREVAAAQVKGNLYAMIKEDIDRSYQHYKERVGAAFAAENFFKEELLRQLADNNPRILGTLPF